MEKIELNESTQVKIENMTTDSDIDQEPLKSRKMKVKQLPQCAFIIDSDLSAIFRCQ